MHLPVGARDRSIKPLTQKSGARCCLTFNSTVAPRALAYALRLARNVQRAFPWLSHTCGCSNACLTLLIGPNGTPSPVNLCNQKPQGFSFKMAEMIGMRVPLFATRALLVANLESTARSALSSTFSAKV